MTAADALTRFSNRAHDYVCYRPAYPRQAIECLQQEFGLRANHAVADIGSGTGIFAQLLLEQGNAVYGVEPNDAMRAAAETQLQSWPRFQSIAATAEATTLSDHSVDWVTAAQAFHWFDVERCRHEFRRILRPRGNICLIWNDWQRESPLVRDYEALVVRYATEYERVCHNHAHTDGRIERCLAPAAPQTRIFANYQDLDLAGLRGRLLSSSYMPTLDQPQSAAMLQDLKSIFDLHAVQGVVRFEYVTRLYVGVYGA